jgi:hypothetical protein
MQILTLLFHQINAHDDLCAALQQMRVIFPALWAQSGFEREHLPARYQWG